MTRYFILLTGATGHVGSVTLVHLLQAGHRVRAAVRSEAKATSLLALPQIQALNTGNNLTFTVVPDIMAPGAYHEAVQDVTHVMHIASPLVTAGDIIPLDQHDSYFIQPAVCGTLNMLEAANSSGTVRRIVITSSIVALVPVEQMEGTQPCDPSHPVRPADRLPFVPGPYHSEFAAYSASKVASLQQAEAWIERMHPAFDVVYLHPSFVVGHNEAAATPAQAMRGTNAVVLAMLLGKRFGPFAGATVHVDDVARIHVAALHPAVLGNQSYILSQPATWGHAKQIAKKAFSKACGAGLLVNEGHVGTTVVPIDASETEACFGIKFASFEEQVKSSVGQFLELRLARKNVQPRSQVSITVKKPAIMEVTPMPSS